MNSSLYRLLGLMLIWAFAASVAGHYRLLYHLPVAAVPVLVASLTIGFSVALHRVEWLRSAVVSLGTRGLIAPHVVRFVGTFFLWLEAQGRLPAEFAQVEGWGDIIIAAGALVLLVWPDGLGFRRAFLAWNVLGALDLLVAVGTGGYLNAARPGAMLEMSQFPLTLVPLWLVPVLLSSHLLMLQGARFLTPRGSTTNAVAQRTSQAHL